MATCPQCGNPVEPANRFCAVCGRDIVGPPVALPVAPLNTQPPPVIPYAGQPQTSGKAIASLILGIFFFCLPTAILAIIFGHLSLSDIKKSAGRLQGRALAITGLVLGYAGIALIPIILIIAAIAIPNLLRARMAADESSAIASLRAINNAELRYRVTYGEFTCQLGDLGGASGSCSASARHACLVDDTLASGRKSGYVFELEKCEAKAYTVVAYPEKFNTTGVRSFCSDAQGIIRYSPSGTAERCLSEGETLN